MSDLDTLKASNVTAVEFPRDVTLVSLFEEQVRRSPDRIAVQFEESTLTYFELHRRAGRVAETLCARGIGPESLVGICLDRSIEMIVGIYGIIMSGAAYVPVDPRYPADRKTFMLSDSRVSTLLTDSKTVAELHLFEGEKIRLDRDVDFEVDSTEHRDPEDPTPDNLAYVIYTSGSTGNPKGVMNEHGAICNRLLWMQSAFELDAADVVLQKTPFSFDVSVWEFFWPLLQGARLVVAKPDGHKDPTYLAEVIERYGVTIMHFVPSMLQVFLDEPELEGRCLSLRHVICSGEVLPVALRDRFFARLEARLHNLYGPTEAAVDVTHWECERHSPRTSIPIGFPIANTTVHILDELGVQVPVGQAGELHIGGVQVARGYLQRKELTAERFVPDPYSEDPGSRLYRTGDLARWLPDGAIEFLGREDFQVKIRGFRIELGEIETFLDALPGVSQSVVVANDTGFGAKQLVAYFTSERSAVVDLTSLRASLLEKLPDYMVPAILYPLEEMPLGPNGKVDRKALPSADRRPRPELSVSYSGPRNPLETFIAEAWAGIVGVDRVGINDPFFEIGGDSLRAAQFVNLMQKELGEFMYVVAIFDAPTVSKMAAFLQRDYPDAVSGRFGTAGSTVMSKRENDSRVGDHELDELRSVVIPLAKETTASTVARNSRAVFVLAPPRSGTTLLRVMLAGHTRLFAAAELQLLGFQTLSERSEAYSGKFKLWLEGTIRAIMEIQSCDAEAAWELMSGFENGGLSTRELYAVLQSWLGDQILVDKSPSYALDPLSLVKAESDFEDAFFVHLVRHPYSMVRSFVDYHMHQVLFLKEHTLSPRQLGEAVWTLSHLNTMKFLDSVPVDRWIRIQYEDLVTDPRLHMTLLCKKLGIAFEEAMIHPYRDIGNKMTDGLYADSTPMGDTRLLERTAIDPSMADKWKGVLEDDFLGDTTWAVAQKLGYKRTSSRPGTPSTGAGRRDRMDLLRRRRNANRP